MTSVEEARDFSELHSNAGAWGSSWDPRRYELVFSFGPDGGAEQPVSLTLRSLGLFQDCVRGLPKASRDSLERLLGAWPERGSALDHGRRLAPFERMARFLAVSRHTFEPVLQLPWERLYNWLLMQGSPHIWLQRHNESLSFPSRYRLLRGAVTGMAVSRKQERDESTFADISDSETREIYWYTLRMQHELATKWAEDGDVPSVEAARAQRQSQLVYLQALREEPYRNELEEFLVRQKETPEARTGTESEVARLLQLGVRRTPRRSARLGELLPVAGSDEAIDGVFFSWFMQRYDLWSGARLMARGMTKRERWATAFSLIFIGLAGLVFAYQIFHRTFQISLPNRPTVVVGPGWIWATQLVLQLAALLTAASCAPKCFNFALPRALFGSLLTWITLVLTSVPGLWAIELDSKDDNLRDRLHEFLTSQPNQTMALAIPVLLLLASVFIMRQIGQWTGNLRLIVERTILTMFLLYGGSVFWGILFAVPIRSVIERSWQDDLSCLAPIACVGGALAALFGIIVELVWEDKSITEPLEEPL